MGASGSRASPAKARPSACYCQLQKVQSKRTRRRDRNNASGTSIGGWINLWIGFRCARGRKPFAGAGRKRSAHASHPHFEPARRSPEFNANPAWFHRSPRLNDSVAHANAIAAHQLPAPARLDSGLRSTWRHAGKSGGALSHNRFTNRTEQLLADIQPGRWLRHLCSLHCATITTHSGFFVRTNRRLGAQLHCPTRRSSISYCATIWHDHSRLATR